MRDRPTYWEYRFANRNEYIRTKNGRFFHAELDKPAKWRVFGVGIAVLALFLVCFLYFGLNTNQFATFSLLFDSIALNLFSILLGNLLRYHFSRFYLIQESSDESSPAPTHRLQKVLFILALILWTFAALNSSSARLLYSAAADNPEVVIATVDGYQLDAFPVTDTNVVSLSGLPKSIHLNISITKAVRNPTFRLDGQLISDYDAHQRYRYHFFWEEHYPRSDYRIWLDIHNGSVLTMDCGDIHREWTFVSSDTES